MAISDSMITATDSISTWNRTMAWNAAYTPRNSLAIKYIMP